MIPVLRKVAQLNITYKKWGLIRDVCTGTPFDEVTALVISASKLNHLQFFNKSILNAYKDFITYPGSEHLGISKTEKRINKDVKLYKND